MSRFSPKLTRMLITRGVARLLTPIYVLWGLADWYAISAVAAVVWGVLTFNYVIVYVLQWVAPALAGGPWRIRPWQSFVMLANVIVLPVVYYRRLGVVPWGFVIVGVLFVVGLYAATWIYFQLQASTPMAAIFARRKAARAAGALKQT